VHFVLEILRIARYSITTIKERQRSNGDDKMATIYAEEIIDFLESIIKASDDPKGTIGLTPEAALSFIASESKKFEASISRRQDANGTDNRA
jgi:hypothetical protein